MKYFLLITTLLLIGCSPKLNQSFKKVSKPEKTWVVFHPFKAKRAFLISKEAEKVKDSMAFTGTIGKDNNGGHLDAFKHSFWMARVTQKIGKRAALTLGKAHEKGNYKTYTKRKLEDGYVPDKASSTMDLFNNTIGVRLGNTHKKIAKKVLVQYVLKALENGELRILSKDSLGNFLDCKGQVIPKDSLRHRWDTQKCLVSSKLK